MHIAAQDPAQLAGARGVGIPPQDGLHVGGRRAVAHLGLVTGARELVGREDRGEVHERAGDRGHGYPTERRHVTGGDLRETVAF